jgi:non-canonical poly(A) RNA polymerase PAPD5/7
VMGVSEKGEEPLYMLEQAISERKIASYIEVIASAKVPIIKFDHIASGISVDILCNNDSGMQTGEILKRAAVDYPAFRPLTVLMKIFLVFISYS